MGMCARLSSEIPQDVISAIYSIDHNEALRDRREAEGG